MTSETNMARNSFEGISELRIYNKYRNLNNFKIRLKDASDPDAFCFPSNSVQTFEVRGATSMCNIYYEGSPIQQLDFNDGGSSDDMNMPNTDGKFNDKNTITYRSNKHSVEQLVNFDTGSCFALTDSDGIDGGSAAVLRAEVQTDPVLETKYLSIIIES